MLKLLLPLLLVSTLFGTKLNVPTHGTKNYAPEIDNLYYGWMRKNKDVYLSAYVSKEVRHLITADDITRYFKLKMRNFVSTLNLQKEFETEDHSWLHISLDCLKYNDTSEIYYGYIRIAYTPSLVNKKHDYQDYLIILPFAQINTSFKDSVKNSLDMVIEKIAEDHYYMQDIKPKK